MPDEAKPKQVVVPLVDHSEDVEILRDIKVPPKFFDRMVFGVPVLDTLFGGDEYPGVMPGTSILYTGHPGAGKSTAMLQMVDLLQSVSGRNVLYNVGEENEFMVKLRADRLGVNGNFALSKFQDVNDLIKYAKATGVEVLVQDSLQSLGDGELEDGMSTLKIVGKKLHRLAKDSDVVVFVVGHITKGGDFAGPMGLKHDLDVHAHMRLNADNGHRELQLTKNRFGPANVPYECVLSARGLDFTNAVLVDQNGEPQTGGRAAERREAILKLIKDKMMLGEEISGYCYNRFEDPISHKMGVECSGGFWRTLVEKAKHSLESEGHIIGRKTVDGRTFFFLDV